MAVLEEASFLHFSDWPVPKPWMPENEKVTRENEPKCWEGREKVEACKERDMWNGFREEFREKREVSLFLFSLSFFFLSFFLLSFFLLPFFLLPFRRRAGEHDADS